MYSIVNKGIIATMDLDSTQLKGSVQDNLHSAYIASLVGGRVVSLKAVNGKACVIPYAADAPIAGVLIQDARGLFYGANLPIGGNVIGVAVGEQIYETDQILDQTLAAATKLYVGEGGLLTAEKGEGNPEWGVSLTAKTATEQTVRVKVG